MNKAENDAHRRGYYVGSKAALMALAAHRSMQGDKIGMDIINEFRKWWMSGEPSPDPDTETPEDYAEGPVLGLDNIMDVMAMEALADAMGMSRDWTEEDHQRALLKHPGLQKEIDASWKRFKAKYISPTAADES